MCSLLKAKVILDEDFLLIISALIPPQHADDKEHLETHGNDVAAKVQVVSEVENACAWVLIPSEQRWPSSSVKTVN
jgi:hypothetical protein